jgi:hypothetical protein
VLGFDPAREPLQAPVQGQTRPFALVEPPASFTLTSRHSTRQSSRRTRADAVGIRSLLAFLEKIRRWADRNSLTAVPETLLDGRWSLQIRLILLKPPRRRDRANAFGP